MRDSSRTCVRHGGCRREDRSRTHLFKTTQNCKGRLRRVCCSSGTTKTQSRPFRSQDRFFFHTGTKLNRESPDPIVASSMKGYIARRESIAKKANSGVPGEL